MQSIKAIILEYSDCRDDEKTMKELSMSEAEFVLYKKFLKGKDDLWLMVTELKTP